MNDANNSSPTEPSQPTNEPMSVHEVELEKLAETSPLHTVVKVVEKNFQEFILLKDYEDKKFWNVINGDKDFTIKTNEWFNQGQRLYKDKCPMTKDDYSRLREVVTAISILGNYFDWDEETISIMMDQFLIKFSYDLYKRTTGSTKKVEDLANDDEFMPYMQMVAALVKSFTKLHEMVVSSLEEQLAQS